MFFPLVSCLFGRARGTVPTFLSSHFSRREPIPSFLLGTGAAYNERSERGIGPRILSAKQAGKDDEVREIDATVSVEIKARLKVGIALA